MALGSFSPRAPAQVLLRRHELERGSELPQLAHPATDSREGSTTRPQPGEGPTTQNQSRGARSGPFRPSDEISRGSEEQMPTACVRTGWKKQDKREKSLAPVFASDVKFTSAEERLLVGASVALEHVLRIPQRCLRMSASRRRLCGGRPHCVSAKPTEILSHRHSQLAVLTSLVHGIGCLSWLKACRIGGPRLGSWEGRGKNGLLCLGRSPKTLQQSRFSSIVLCPRFFGVELNVCIRNDKLLDQCRQDVE